MMDNKQCCAYCNQSNFDTNGKCLGCGGQRRATQGPERHAEKGEPFFYNGFMVWPVYRANDFLERNAIEYQFWLGERFIDSVLMTREFVNDIFPHGEDTFTDIMLLVWRLFEVKCGDGEIAFLDTAKENVQRYNTERETLVFVRRMQMPEERSRYYEGLSWDELVRLKEEAYS